jgi:hypothetical protein
MIKQKFQIYPLGQIRAGGIILERMNRTVEKILRHTKIREEFLQHFQHRSEKPTAPGGFVGFGMLLDAIVKAAAQGLGGEEMLALKEQFIGDLIRTQTPDGNISIFSGNPGTWDNHEQAYIIQAFVLDFTLFGNRKALESAAKLGSFMIRKETKANIGIEQAFLMLYEQTKDPLFLNYCVDQLKIRGSMEEYDEILPVNGIPHVYTYLARTLAQLKYAVVTGDADPHLADGMHEAFDRVLHGGYAMVTGGVSGGQYWGEVWDTSQLGLGRCAETCAAAYLLRDAIHMTALEGKAVYGDVFERTMYNTFFAAQSHDGCSQKYFIPINESGTWYEKDTYCCPNNFKRMVFELPQAICFKAEDGIAVNLYNAFSLDDETAFLELRGDYPDSETMVLKVEPKTERKFALYFRIPLWCGNAEFRIGDECFTGKPGTFLKIERQWSKCLLKITLPMRIRFIAGKMAQTGKAAVLRGPVVYGWKRDPKVRADLPKFDPDPGMEYKNGHIAVPVVYRCCGIQKKHLDLIPFSDPERERIYFFAPERTETDELFQ